MSDDTVRPRLAACLVCRRSKVKCGWTPNEERCRRCIQLGRECIRPDVHVGRQKGTKNKRVGLEKAFFQVEQAVRRVASGEPHRPEDGGMVERLRELLDAAQAAEPLSASASMDTFQDAYETSSEGDDAVVAADEDASNLASTPDVPPAGVETLPVDDAENPLQLLARASYFQPHEEPRAADRGQPSASPAVRGTRDSHKHHRGVLSDKSRETKDLQAFFASATSANLDVGDDVDPVSLGLATAEEAESLFTYFYEKLSHTRWGLDPRIYTLPYTRSRSAFLTTSIMAASALFWPSAGALSKRLSNHARTLASRIMPNQHRSVEIVLAFLLNVPWMSPGVHSTRDETSAYISMAMTIAIDLGLHKVLIPPEMLGPGTGIAVARGECLDPKTALVMDGYQDVDPSSEEAALLLRSRERCWISLFVLERGTCLARGRPFVVPVTRLLRDCDDWHKSPLAEAQDGSLLSMAVLRRDLDGLFAAVRALCDGSEAPNSDGSLAAQSIEGEIERFFDQWYSNWGFAIGAGPEHRLPPYVDILVTHLRLSIYGSVINHPTASLEVRRFFRTAGLSSALNVMRAAIRGESQLQSMPNNTAIMISFAACFALTLSAYATGGSSLAPSVRKLIDEAAGVLVRTGTLVEHRNGLSKLYGKHLRHIVRRAAKGGHGGGLRMSTSPSSATLAQTTSSPDQSQQKQKRQKQQHEQQLQTAQQQTAQQQTSHQQSQQQQQQQIFWPEALEFSTMSDNQIMSVLNQPGNAFEPSFEGLSWDDMNNFDWLHWPEFSS